MPFLFFIKVIHERSVLLGIAGAPFYFLKGRKRRGF